MTVVNGHGDQLCDPGFQEPGQLLAPLESWFMGSLCLVNVEECTLRGPGTGTCASEGSIPARGTAAGPCVYPGAIISTCHDLEFRPRPKIRVASSTVAPGVTAFLLHSPGLGRWERAPGEVGGALKRQMLWGPGACRAVGCDRCPLRAEMEPVALPEGVWPAALPCLVWEVNRPPGGKVGVGHPGPPTQELLRPRAAGVTENTILACSPCFY